MIPYFYAKITFFIQHLSRQLLLDTITLALSPMKGVYYALAVAKEAQTPKASGSAGVARTCNAPKNEVPDAVPARHHRL